VRATPAAAARAARSRDLRTRSPADLKASLHFEAGRGWRVEGAEVSVLCTSLEWLVARVLFAELHGCAAGACALASQHASTCRVASEGCQRAVRLCQEAVNFVLVDSGVCSLCVTQLRCALAGASACACFSRAVVCRASWVGATNKLRSASDAAFAELVGTDADYHHFKRVSGAAAVQRAIEDVKASLSRLKPAARAGDAQGAVAQNNDSLAAG
jgi:hypothetical protein